MATLQSWFHDQIQFWAQVYLKKMHTKTVARKELKTKIRTLKTIS